VEHPEKMIVQLTCATYERQFSYELTKSAEWIAKYWQGAFPLMCPLCGREHTYNTKKVVMGTALAAPAPIGDSKSASKPVRTTH
jgi:hypothetical protein